MMMMKKITTTTTTTTTKYYRVPIEGLTFLSYQTDYL